MIDHDRPEGPGRDSRTGVEAVSSFPDRGRKKTDPLKKRKFHHQQQYIAEMWMWQMITD
jgi:hypothetical protein